MKKTRRVATASPFPCRSSPSLAVPWGNPIIGNFLVQKIPESARGAASRRGRGWLGSGRPPRPLIGHSYA